MITEVIAGGASFWIGLAIGPAKEALSKRLGRSTHFRSNAAKIYKMVQTKFPSLKQDGDEVAVKAVGSVSSSVVHTLGWGLTSAALILACKANEDSARAQYATIDTQLKALKEDQKEIHETVRRVEAVEGKQMKQNGVQEALERRVKATEDNQMKLKAYILAMHEQRSTFTRKSVVIDPLLNLQKLRESVSNGN